ncbi:dipeptide/oligopeptide/nickel ABC transporter permease/ATP-binding protein [Brachybacterium nesterenkovii]|uniref:Oligopeptide transport system permease protein OppB (TC 3.A.1.5.1) n=1 Tax=Brachybacterium nesterenkovii TaxID=47847 RepID=A0A1X6X1H5_9MICO|nr:dipeptide/oligopeptide/nickel ABC transporter permease/ATP-binding protein [Brachybacterium nesterenkovii]SLM92312.1 Oligopeptide transport system permease protein OppB (TC 3.A.1.5.1) [Brachybacterium nesterenkovii]
MRPALGSRLRATSGGRLGGFRSLPWPSRIAIAFLALLVLAAAIGPFLVPHDAFTTGTPVGPPSADHPFGTDANGRDILARVLRGARASLLIGLMATAGALAAAAVLGSIAATASKWGSEILMRVLDVIMSFPGIALAAVFIAVFGTSLPVIVFAIGFLYVPQLSRVIRANVLAQFGEDYVAASKVMGASTPWILLKHVARNCMAPIMVFATVLVADAIVFEASLSFINAGVQPPEPSWGNILAGGKEVLLGGYWWPTFFPGLMILLTVLSLNILSEGLTDAFASPRVRSRADVEADEQAMREDDHPAEVLGATDDETAREVLRTSLAHLRRAETERAPRELVDAEAPAVLEVRDLRVAFPEAHGDVDIVDGVSFTVRAGETMGLVGESGSGKSVTALAIMGLLPRTARISGEVLLDGRDLLSMSARELNALRGNEIAMIYQDALSSLNPSMLIRSQMAQLTRRGGTRSAEELLELVGLDPQRTLASYPHELSGGQRQRVLIAMALTRDPKLVIADEPTTALDVTVQKQVVELLDRLRRELGFAMVFVSHDLALVAALAHRITVMYAGQVVERADTRELLLDPRHEYTRGLLGSVLSIEAGAERLHQVPGTVPSPREFAVGDRFAPRSQDPDADPAAPLRLLRVGDADHEVASTGDVPAALEGALR